MEEHTVEDYERSMTIEGFLDLNEIPFSLPKLCLTKDASFLMTFIQVQKVLKILPI